VQKVDPFTATDVAGKVGPTIDGLVFEPAHQAMNGRFVLDGNKKVQIMRRANVSMNVDREAADHCVDDDCTSERSGQFP
jgi:hypothetical protein